MCSNRIIKALLLLSSLAASAAFSPTQCNVGNHLNSLGRNLPRLVQPAAINKKVRKHGDHSTTKLNSVVEIVGTSPEPIHTAFSLATFGPQPFWVLMILLPKSDLTKKVMGTMGTCHRFLLVDTCLHYSDVDFQFFLASLDVVLFFALLHFSIVTSSIVQSGATAPLLEFNNVFDPSGDPQAAFMNMVSNYPNFVAEGMSDCFLCLSSKSAAAFVLSHAIWLVHRMVACADLGFVRWTLGLARWAAPWGFYFSFCIVLQSYRPSGSAPSLGYLSSDWKGFH